MTTCWLFRSLKIVPVMQWHATHEHFWDCDFSEHRTFRYSPANTPHVGQICTQLCLIQEPCYKIGLEKDGVTWFVLPPGGRIGFDLRRYFSNKTCKQYIWGKNYNSNYLGKVSFIQGQYYKFRKGYISVRKAWKSSQSDELLLEIHSFLKIYQCILTIHCSRFS